MRCRDSLGRHYLKAQQSTMKSLGLSMQTPLTTTAGARCTWPFSSCLVHTCFGGMVPRYCLLTVIDVRLTLVCLDIAVICVRCPALLPAGECARWALPCPIRRHLQRHGHHWNQGLLSTAKVLHHTDGCLLCGR